MEIPIQKIPLDFSSNIQLDMLRADFNHPYISGNKYWKLKFPLQEAKAQNASCILTFGGAYSNHIYALACASKELGIPSIGIIRGEELKNRPFNSTLTQAQKWGMQLYFITREEYRKKEGSSLIQELKHTHPGLYLIPEGGSHPLGVKGVSEAAKGFIQGYDYIAVSVGTGGTLAGIVQSSLPSQKIIGFPALKNGAFLEKEVRKFTPKDNFHLDLRYHFGGYGKWTPELKEFILNFYQQTQIPLDRIYTGKMIWGLLKNIENKEYPANSKILAIHTGGLQGNSYSLQFNDL